MGDTRKHALEAKVGDAAIDKAIGSELCRTREWLGMSREDIARLTPGISKRALTSYEHGTRACSTKNLVYICRALGVSTSSLVSLAFQRHGIEFETNGIHVDVNLIVKARKGKNAALHRWAEMRLKSNPGSTVVRLERRSVDDIAALLGLEPAALLRQLLPFTAEWTPCPVCAGTLVIG